MTEKPTKDKDAEEIKEKSKNKEMQKIEKSEKLGPTEKASSKEGIPKEPSVSKKEEGEKKKGDFKYIVRVADTDLDGEKTVVYGLTKIKGIGLHLATFIADNAGLKRDEKIGNLKDSDVEKIKNAIGNLQSNVPAWMLNRRRDPYSGENKHFISSEIAMGLRDDINLLKKIRSYRGIRHERGLRVRGQRTRSNSRIGLSLGVSRKAQIAAQKAARKE